MNTSRTYTFVSDGDFAVVTVNSLDRDGRQYSYPLDPDSAHQLITEFDAALYRALPESETTYPKEENMNGKLSTQSLRPYITPLAELFLICGHVSVHDGDVTFWANAVRNHTKELIDVLANLERALGKRELAERTEAIVSEVAR